MNTRFHFLCRLGVLLTLLPVSFIPAPASAEQTMREEALAAMKKAATFMSEEVALQGGYVWLVSEDLSRRWGEVRARPSQIWLQGGTERVGEVFLDAFEATGDDYYLDAARKAADAVVFGQVPTGGWHYFIDFDPTGDPDWYKTQSSKFRYGMEEHRYYYGNATFDDQVTQNAAMFLLRFYSLTHEAAYREPVLQALDFVLRAQYPNGAWPQRFPLRDDYAHDGFPDYTSYYTLNDGSMESTIRLLLHAWRVLGDPRYFESAKRGADVLIAMQGPEGQAAWAEQYGPDLQPIAARTHEPAGYVVRESIQVLYVLAQFYLITGDPRYLEPIPACLDWFDRINAESAAARYPRPRYWEPGTNRPLYVVRIDETTPEGYGKYIWTTDPEKTDCEGQPCKGDGEPIVDVAWFREHYEIGAALTTAQERRQYLDKSLASQASTPLAEASVADIIAGLDSRGAWVTDGNTAHNPDPALEPEVEEMVRGISTRIFANNLSTLIQYIETPRSN